MNAGTAAQLPADTPTTASPSRPLPGTGCVAKLVILFEGQQQQQPAAGPSPGSASAVAAARAKRQRTAGGPPLPDEWLQSPPLANGGAGAEAAASRGPVERELFEEASSEAAHADTSGGRGDAAAREARLQAIRAK